MKKCYYLTSKNKNDLLDELKMVSSKYDIIAWPAEIYDTNDSNELLQMLEEIREYCSKELLFAYREIPGLEANYLEDNDFVHLMKQVMLHNLADIVEIPMFKGEEVVSTLIEYAKEHSVTSMLSVYSTDGLPTSEQIQIRYQAMQRLGAQIGYQSFKINSEIDYLSIWTGMANFKLWKANNTFVANVYGYDSDFVNTGTMKQGSNWLVVDNNLLVN